MKIIKVVIRAFEECKCGFRRPASINKIYPSGGISYFLHDEGQCPMCGRNFGKIVVFTESKEEK